MLFLHSTADEVVPYSQAVDMMNELKAAGVQAGVSTGEGPATDPSTDPSGRSRR